MTLRRMLFILVIIMIIGWAAIDFYQTIAPSVQIAMEPRR